jgi:hypothetical protein
VPQHTSLSSTVSAAALAFVSVAGALLLTQALHSVFPTPLFFAAIVVSTWFGGMVSGLLAVALAGILVMPKSEDFIRYILQRFESVRVLVLLPLFFAYSGLRTSISVAHHGMWWVYASIVIMVAIAGKLGGSMIAARFAGIECRDAASLGILMNTRGSMELVILNIGLDMGVISTAVFSMTVLMALVTTFMTTPLLEWSTQPA